MNAPTPAEPAPFARAIHLLYVPTLCCNLSCSYCYLGKQTTEAALKLDTGWPPIVAPPALLA